MNRKGQALVEFVLILPIFLFILLSIYDIGKIYNAKNKLMLASSDIVNMYNKKESIMEIQKNYQNVLVTKTISDEYVTLKIESTVSIKTPVLKNILGDPYHIEVERFIPNEE